MKEKEELWRLAVGLLPERIAKEAAAADRKKWDKAEELRLRMGQPVQLLLPEEEISFGPRLTAADLEEVLDRASQFSRYTAAETLAQGYVTAQGGLRTGVCGTVIRRADGCAGIREISSLNIRIPSEVRGAADTVLPQLLEEGRPVSTLVLSPPGGGKTTLLRDMVRLFSAGTPISRPFRVALVDERGELAAMHRGMPQLDVGPRTDILDGCPKMEAIPMLLRAMNPQIIALDELSGRGDAQAVRQAAGCGVSILATVHAAAVEELREHGAMKALLEMRVFRRAVIITGRGSCRQYLVEELK